MSRPSSAFRRADNPARPTGGEKTGGVDRPLEPGDGSMPRQTLAGSPGVRHRPSAAGWGEVLTHHNHASLTNGERGDIRSRCAFITRGRLAFGSVSLPGHLVGDQPFPIGHALVANGSSTEAVFLARSCGVDVVNGGVEDLARSVSRSASTGLSHSHSHPRWCLRATLGSRGFAQGLRPLSLSATAPIL